jgi:hypothetical protein
MVWGDSVALKNERLQMIKQFYSQVLPSTGLYCVFTIDKVDSKKVRAHWVESIDDLDTKVEELKKAEQFHIFVALSSFNKASRVAKEAKLTKSFFVDLDVGEGKGYPTKEEAIEALTTFVQDTQLPPPVRVDSGRGIHAYWILDTEIKPDEWKAYADKFKDLCIAKGLNIDSTVTADLARVLRCPDTLNFKTEPPSPTNVIDDIVVYSYDMFREFLGEVKFEESLESILQSVPKGLTDEEKIMHKTDNFESNFTDLVLKSLDGHGCNQIRYIIENAKTLPEPIWYSGLSIAQHCVDREEAIHKMSEEYSGYDREATIRKADATQGKPHSCETFNSVNPGICGGCPHRGKITNPLALGKVFKIARAVEHTTSNEVSIGGTVLPSLKRGLPGLPKELSPFAYGLNGGIYYQPPTVFDDDGQPLPAKPPVLVTPYDIWPTKRIFSTVDGECLLMKAILPNDPDREFILPMKHVYALEKFKEIITSIGIYPDPNTKQGAYLMSYIINWGQYLVAKQSAEIMRMQMGWTPDNEAFVIGDREITKDGRILSSPTSALCKGIAKHLTAQGSYDEWKKAANYLNKPSMELHAFTLLSGFGSALMHLSSTSGVTISLTGEPGAAKTGALYGALSVWGNPKDLSILEATSNGMTGRYLGLHNIPFGLDEVGNIQAKDLSQLIHKISQGKSKIRMQASVNAERDHEMSASLIAIFTSNHSLYDRLTTIKKDPSGEVARLIELSIRKPKMLIDNPELGRAVFDVFRYNYGWAGPDFIKVFFGYHHSDISAMMNNWIVKFKNDFGEDTAYRFYENLVAVTMTAGEIAVNAGILEYDLERIYKRITGEMINIRDNVVKVNNIDYESLIGEFINNHQTGILAFKDNKIAMEPRTSLVIRAEADNNIIFIAKPEFRKFLIEKQVSTREFLYQMKQAGIEVTEKRKKMGSGWKDATSVVNVEAYVFPSDKFSTDTIKVIQTETA